MPTILVTGATAGLGLALSKLLLERTSSVLVLTARASSLPRFEAEGLVAGAAAALLPALRHRWQSVPAFLETNGKA